ncbi:MAG: hypothetical protein M0D57_01635 [Sphingobacteriales bacterium JAD_PAG50586_3]|nr:MAG: hypothetical protein M0D57_01635 [Sphingobacteriales bacterium JAD_PAG50586_3]
MLNNISHKAIMPVLVLFMLALAAPDMQAQRMRRNNRAGGPVLRVKSKRVLRRTAVVMLAAHADLKKGKVYTGDFARAVRHQRYAVFLWRRGFYARSIHHSRRARMLAINVIQANKGTVQPGYKMDKEENALSKDSPADSQLDNDLKTDTEFSKNSPATSEKDEDFINIMVDDIDLSDLE